jgi:hypothetical protein
VDVKMGPGLDLVVRPWTRADPVLLEPGYEFGEKVREGEAGVNFDRLTVDEWRSLVTPAVGRVDRD